MSVGAMWHDEESGWLIQVGADTQIGNYRERNEDFVLLDSELPLALVLDGMGGPNGDRAAQVSAEAIRARVRTGHANDEPPEALLEAAFRAGHDALLRWRDADPEHRGGGSTVVAAWVQNGRVYVTWLGDSRAYRLTGGQLQPLTTDHDWRNEVARRQGVTAEEIARQYPSNALVYHLGNWEPEVRLGFPSFTPLPGDRLILTTDGVWGLLDDDTFLNTCRAISDPTTCAEALVEHALMAGSRDNCTCAVIAFERAGDDPAPKSPQPPRKWWRFWR